MRKSQKVVPISTSSIFTIIEQKFSETVPHSTSQSIAQAEVGIGRSEML